MNSFTALLLVIGAGLPTDPAPHPEAVLQADRTTVEAGGTIVLEGSQFGDGGTYKLRLLGVLNEHELGDVRSDADGIFTHELTIPSDVRPGAFQVVAMAPDGDVAARLDLTVTAASAPPTAGQTSQPMDMSMEDHAATAEEIRIERDRTGVEWGAIGLVIGVAGGLGIGLRRRTATA